MNNNLQITTLLDQPGLLENLVEKLAERRYDIGYSNAMVPESWNALETSSVETYLSGTVAFTDSTEDDAIDTKINMPFITSFLFTCIKEKKGMYHLAWSSSLS